MDLNARYDCVALLAKQRPFSYPRYTRLIRRKRKPHCVKTKSVTGQEIRPSQLQARRYFPTHPLLKISKKLPLKLPTMAELEKLDHEALAARFLKHCAKFKQ